MAPRLTDRELDIMDVLWEQESGTVAEVRDRLTDDLAYTTVLTILRTLEMKGHVSHEEEGKAHRYYPLIDKRKAGTTAVTHVVRKLFNGSPTALVAHLVDEKELSRGEIKRLRKMLDDRLKGSRRAEK
jgi:BlaI family transcriptional regulator, penicillinase repressor